METKSWNPVHTLQDRRTVSRSRSPSRSRSRSYSRSRSRSYSRSPSRSRLRSASPRRYNRSVTPPPRRTFGPRPHQHPAAPAPVHGIPPPGSGPPPPQAPSQPYGVLPPVSSFPPSSGAFGHMAPNPLAGMFQALPAAPPTNPMLVNQQVWTTAVSVSVQSPTALTQAWWHHAYMLHTGGLLTAPRPHVGRYPGLYVPDPRCWTRNEWMNKEAHEHMNE